MTHDDARSGRYFSDAARAKALEARRMKASKPKRHVEVFITRDPAGGRLFAWEIRWFGGVVLDRSAARFVDVADARRTGEAALAAK